jgi:tRNA(Ile)-lysidine synthase TilS/MesJ
MAKRKQQQRITDLRTALQELLAMEYVENGQTLTGAQTIAAALYSKAKDLGCNKIALGHHYDDVIETILMGMLYGAQIQTMMPKLHSTNFDGMELIRPMYLIREKDIIRWRDYNDLHFIQCACRLTESCASCGGTEQGSKRGAVKDLIRTLTAQNPQIEKNIFRSVENVNLDTVIAYKQGRTRHHFLDSYVQERVHQNG